MKQLFSRAQRRLQAFASNLIGVDPYTSIKIDHEQGLQRLGEECGWMVPIPRLSPGCVCYCVGAGEDISFDVALAERYLCDVHTFDPTPKAVAYVSSALRSLSTPISFHPWGVWERDGLVRMYAPRNPSHVSYSAINLQRTDEFFEADCRSLRSIMTDLGHRRIQLLKLDIEGAEYQVLKSMIADEIFPSILAVEFDEVHTPIDGGANARVRSAVNMLIGVRYHLVAVAGPNYVFVR